MIVTTIIEQAKVHYRPSLYFIHEPLLSAHRQQLGLIVYYQA